MFNPTQKESPQPKTSTKAASTEKQFADLVLTNKFGQWMMRAESTSDAGTAYKWNSLFWQYVHTEEGRSLVAQWLDQHHPDKASSSTAKNAWDFACDRLRQENPAPSVNHHQHIIPTLSGYLHLHTDGRIELSKPDPSLGVDYVIQAKLSSQIKEGEDYVPQPVSPQSLFGQFLDASLPDLSIRNVVQELCAQSLLPMNYNIAGWFVGQGANGKGVMMEVIEAIHRQSCRLRLDRLAEKFSLEPLVGSSIVLVDEVANAKFDEELFKSLVAGNGVDVDRKYDKPLRSYRSHAKWIIASNNVPHIRDKSDGVWRRIVFIPWQVQIEEGKRIPDLDKKIIESELHIVLDWLLEGAVRIVKRGRFRSEDEMPAIIQAQKHTMRLESDSILAWIEDEGIHCSSSTETSNDEIYKAYRDWCEQTQRTAMGSEMFWKSLRARFPKMTTTNRRVGAKRKRYSTLSLIPMEQLPAVKQAVIVDEKFSEVTEIF